MSANGHLADIANQADDPFIGRDNADIATVAGGNDGIVAAMRHDRLRPDRASFSSDPGQQDRYGHLATRAGAGEW
jgi:hypothetical protein